MDKSQSTNGHPDPPVEWDDLLSSISRGNCVVCVGPQILSPDPSRSFEDILAEHLEANADRLKIRVYENGWFHFLPDAFEQRTYNSIRNFYQEHSQYALPALEKIASIRLPLIVNMNPDESLRTAFSKYEKPVFDHYVKNKQEFNRLEKPSPDAPLAYQLLGNLQEVHSLVFTYDDFYDYLESVFTAKSMSPVLKETIFEAECFLFIGMPFDQWYVHLFMRILELERRKKKKGTSKFAIPKPKNNREFSNEQYNIHFINSNVDTFLDELVERCKKQGLTRTPHNRDTQAIEGALTKDDFFNTLERLFINSDFDEIYEKVKWVLNNTGKAGQEILLNFQELQRRWKENDKLPNQLSQSTDEQNANKSKISIDYMKAIHELKDRWPHLNIRL